MPKNLNIVTNLLGSSIFFSINCFFQTGMAAILRSSSSLALFCIASFLPFSAAFLAIISRFHLGISAPLGSWVGTCKDFSDHYTICPSQQIRDGRIRRWSHCSKKSNMIDLKFFCYLHSWIRSAVISDYRIITDEIKTFWGESKSLSNMPFYLSARLLHRLNRLAGA